MDPASHRRFLEYRERHRYFGAEGTSPVPYERFVPLDAEHRALEDLGEDRDDEQEVRFAELARLLFRD
ncbi:MAG: hypothetical protein JOZ69_13570 [Myxococcales bacterium]|nr:hypothetical protein [Myxococcales bacterium]